MTHFGTVERSLVLTMLLLYLVLWICISSYLQMNENSASINLQSNRIAQNWTKQLFFLQKASLMKQHFNRDINYPVIWWDSFKIHIHLQTIKNILKPPFFHLIGGIVLMQQKSSQQLAQQGRWLMFSYLLPCGKTTACKNDPIRFRQIFLLYCCCCFHLKDHVKLLSSSDPHAFFLPKLE